MAVTWCITFMEVGGAQSVDRVLTVRRNEQRERSVSLL